jgi:trigger factor
MFSPKVKVKNIYNKDLSPQWEITIPSEIVEELRDLELQEAASELTVQGFRKGKAPLNELVKVYGERAVGIAVNKKISEEVDKIIVENKYNIFSRPEISLNTEDLANADKIIAKVSFILKPEVKIDYSKLTFDVKKVKLSEKEIQKELDNLALRFGTFEESKDDSYLTKQGDSVNIKFIGRIDDKEFDGGFAESFHLALGSNQFIDGFEKQLENKKKGETVFVSVKFPAEYHVQDLAKKDAIFETTINSVSVKVPHEINEELAKKFQLNSVEELKNNLINNVEEFMNERVVSDMKQEFFKKMSEFVQEVPAKILDSEIERHFKIAQAKDANLDAKTFRKNEEKNIANRIKTFLIVNHFEGEFKDITVSEQDLLEFITKFAMYSGVNPQQELKNMKKEQIENTKRYLYEEKLYKAVFEKVKKNFTEYSREEFEKLSK